MARWRPLEGCDSVCLKCFALLQVLFLLPLVWSCETFFPYCLLKKRTFWSTHFVEKQYCTVDHLARGSMKNAANCASECELQDIWASTLWTHIAGCDLFTAHTWLRVGLSSIQLFCWHWAFPSLIPGGLKIFRTSLCLECWLSGCLLSLGWHQSSLLSFCKGLCIFLAESSFFFTTWEQVRLPAKFKHINKRRKRK